MAVMPAGSVSVGITAGGDRTARPLAMAQSLTVSTRASFSASFNGGG